MMYCMCTMMILFLAIVGARRVPQRWLVNDAPARGIESRHPSVVIW